MQMDAADKVHPNDVKLKPRHNGVAFFIQFPQGL